MKAQSYGKGRFFSALLLSIILLAFFGSPLAALDKKEYKIYIVSDTLKDKFVELQTGFRETLDKQLAAVGARAAYTVFDTKTDKSTVPGIIKAIQDGQPDLIAVINSSGVFADTNITSKLTDPKFRFVVENCIPVQSGIAKTWDKPGGNVTGVGVFVQFASTIKLAQRINPGYKKLVSWTWATMKPVNDYLVSELKAACKVTGVELAEMKYLDSLEDEQDAMLAADKLGAEYMVIPLLSAWVHKDGSPADAIGENLPFLRQKIWHIPWFAWDEATVKAGGSPAGTCVVWYDLGAQMAEKSMKVLGGADPGNLAWEYPRKYNLIFNLAQAKKIGMEIPDELIRAAYRVYTDYEGNFLGAKN